MLGRCERAVLATLCLCAASTVNSSAGIARTGAPAKQSVVGVVINLVTTPLHPRERATLSAEPVGANRCELSFNGPGGLRDGPYDADVSAKQVAWSWIVPRDARAGHWRVSVACHGQGDSLSTQPIFVVGDAKGHTPIVDASTLGVTSIAAYDGGKDPGKGGGGDCSPGALDEDSGYCTGFATEFVWSLRRDLAGLGNPSEWWANTRSKRGHVAAIGAVAWWRASQPNRPYGHVAYVTAVGGGAVTVREMNHGNRWGLADTRVIDLASQEAPDGYIYRHLRTVAHIEKASIRGALTFKLNSGGRLGPKIGPFQSVRVSCRIAAGLRGEMMYSIASPPWSFRYLARASSFLNGDSAGGPRLHRVDSDVPGCIHAKRLYAIAGVVVGRSPAGPPPPPPSAHVEIAGHYGVPTFREHRFAKGAGPRIEAYGEVLVSCRLPDDVTRIGFPGGYWYRIAADPWNDEYYAPANAFLNGDAPGGPFVHRQDSRLPFC